MFGKIKCNFCGTENPAGSRYCRQCGKPVGDKSYSTCPKCGADVQSGASFCGKCGTRLTDSPRTEATVSTSKEFDRNQIWMRKPGDFAQKFELSDIKGFFSKKVTVEQGTNAVFLQGGVYKGILPAGVYTFDNFLKRIFGIKQDSITTVILVDAGDIPLTFAFSENELRAKNAFNVSASGRLTAKITDAAAFLENYLKGGNHVSLTDIEIFIHDELLIKAQNTISKYNTEELYGNAELSNRLENEFRTSLNESLKRKGLEITQLNCVGFDEGAYKEVIRIRNEAEIEIGIAKAEYEKNIKIRGYKNADEADRIESDYAVKKTDQKGRHEIEDAETDHRIAQNEKIHDSEIKEDKKDFDMILDVKRRQREDKRADEKQRIENLDSASIEAKIIINGGTAEDLKDLEKMKRAASLNADQILALNATDPKAAGEALAAKAKLQSIEELNELRVKDQMAFNKMMQEQYKENAEQMKEVMNSALTAMGNTATARATAQNPGATVVSGGLGAPVIINSSNKKCKCGTSLSDDDLFCPECGKKVN